MSNEIYIGKDGQQYRFGSEKNKRIIKKMTSREVLADVTSIVDYFFDGKLSPSGAPIDDTMLLDTPAHFECPYCGETVTEDDAVEVTDADCDELVVVTDETNPEFPYVCPICEAAHQREEDARYCCAGSTLYVCGNCEEAFSLDDVIENDSPLCASQWLIVTKWLGKRLAEQCESVLKTGDGTFIWGRKFSDGIDAERAIRTICCEAKILEGQEKEVNA